MPSPTGMLTPGARNFNGASTKEIASTMPSHTNATAPVTAVDVIVWIPFPSSPIDLLRSAADQAAGSAVSGGGSAVTVTGAGTRPTPGKARHAPVRSRAPCRSLPPPRTAPYSFYKQG